MKGVQKQGEMERGEEKWLGGVRALAYGQSQEKGST